MANSRHSPTPVSVIDVDALDHDASNRTSFTPSQPLAKLPDVLDAAVVHCALQHRIDRGVLEQFATGKPAVVCRRSNRQGERVIPAIVWTTIALFERRRDPREQIANLDQHAYGYVIGWTVA